MLRKFIPLFIVQLLAVVNDNIFKNAMLVLVFYYNEHFLNFSSEQTANIANFVFILPFFLFSSWAGKIADIYSKTTITKWVKYVEIIIMLIIIYGLLFHNISLLMLSLLLMGIHSTIFGPIKFSILPLYFKNNDSIFKANAWIESGSFIAILLGQIIGSYFMNDKQINIILLVISFCSITGLISSYFMYPVDNQPLNKHHKIYKNFLYDTYLTCKLILKNQQIKENLYAISWFWAFGALYTIQLPNFIIHYLGGNSHVYTFILSLFCIGIGAGSLICSRLSNGKIKVNYAFWGMVLVSIFSLLLVNIFHKLYNDQLLDITQFVASQSGVIAVILFFLIGFFAGFYSVTCYNSLPVIAPIEILSQVIGVNNILNASFMVLITLFSMVILVFTNVSNLFIIISILNIYFAYRYNSKVKVMN